MCHLLLALALGLACGVDEDTPGRVQPVETSGQFEVTGVTVEKRTGTQRPIAGKVVLVQEGDRYTAHFELSTPYGGSGAAAAEVIGTGEGRVAGNTLRGRAETQLVLAQVPGVDVGFAFGPRQVGPRIVSTSVVEFFPDGSIHIEMQNRPASEEEDYTPSETTLVGYRLGDAPRTRP
ncbi:MAG: hypothetical protein ABFS46_16690 [Myxococcota bacterium]